METNQKTEQKETGRSVTRRSFLRNSAAIAAGVTRAQLRPYRKSRRVGRTLQETIAVTGFLATIPTMAQGLWGWGTSSGSHMVLTVLITYLGYFIVGVATEPPAIKRATAAVGAGAAPV